MPMPKKKPLCIAVSTALGTASVLGMSPVSAQEEQEQVEEVVVTGTRIQRANLESAIPITQLDSEQLRYTGVTRIEDALVALPGIQLEQSSGQAIEATGTATLELRRLGASRTLVLMNGRRLPVHSPSSTTSAADINMIPGQLVERVEVLTGGASSTYGADAVAGVVNFILQDNFEGIRFDYQTSTNRHDNSARDIQGAAQRAGQPFARGTATDGEIHDMTLLVGSNFADDRGNATVWATYRDIAGVTQAERDHSACPVRASGECLGSATNQTGTFFFDDPSTNYRVEGNEFLEGLGPGFNFAAPSYFQRPDERVTMGTLTHYDFNDSIEGYTELMFMDTKSTTQFGPAGLFLATNVDVNCGNPFLSDQQIALIESTGRCQSGDPDELFDVNLGRRAVEGGPRMGELRHTTYRGVFGVRGEINETWRFDASYQYAEVDMRNANSGYVFTAGARQALDVVLDGNGDPACRDTSFSCVPWNIFETGGVTPEAAAFLNAPVLESGSTTQEVIMAYAQGSLGDYGVISPFAVEGVELVVGAEYRDESLTYTGSLNAQQGEAGGFGTLVPIRGDYDVREIYMEASVPIAQDKPFMRSLSVDVGYRFSDYDFGPTTDTYKFAGTWAINYDVTLRGSYQRAVRAPNVVDLFRPESPSLFAMDQEPCEKTGDPGAALSDQLYTFEQCARTGVTQALWDAGGPISNPASQYNDIEGGSLDIEPEEADTFTAGFLYTPASGFLEGLTLSVDYYHIEVDGAIQGVQAETTLTQCLLTGDPTFCNAVQRDEFGSLWLGNPQTLQNSIDARSTNIGFLSVDGVDVELNYAFEAGNLGTINIANVMGYVIEYEQEEFPGAASLRCDGIYGGGCQLPTPELGNRMQVTWLTPWDINASFIWRYTKGTQQAASAQPLDIDDISYIDLSGNWQVNDWAQVRLGINNVFDERPPRVYQGVTDFENGNTYPGFFDPLGQYLFAGFTLQYQ